MLSDHPERNKKQKERSMDTQDVANHLTNVLREVCPRIQHDYPLVFIEYTLCRELEIIIEEARRGANDNQPDLFG